MFIIRSTKPLSTARYIAYNTITNLTIPTIPFINALIIIDFLFYYIKLIIPFIIITPNAATFITNNVAAIVPNVYFTIVS